MRLVRVFIGATKKRKAGNTAEATSTGSRVQKNPLVIRDIREFFATENSNLCTHKIQRNFTDILEFKYWFQNQGDQPGTSTTTEPVGQNTHNNNNGDGTMGHKPPEGK